MYFIVALACTVIAGALWFFFRERKGLHLEILAITFGASTLMWLIDVIFTAAEGENPFGFEQLDGWISLWTVLGGIFLWLVLSFILNNRQKQVEAK